MALARDFRGGRGNDLPGWRREWTVTAQFFALRESFLLASVFRLPKAQVWDITFL